MKNKILTLVVIGFMACTVLSFAGMTGEKNNKAAIEKIGISELDFASRKGKLFRRLERFKSGFEQKYP